MQVNFRNKDFWSGVMLVVIGLGAGWIAQGYPMGTVLRMGSGYFPTVLSGILCLFGVLLMLRAVKTSESIEGGWSFRALVILPISFALFGFLLDRAGFVPAMLVIVIGSALAGSEFRLIEVLGLAVLMTVLSIGIFIYGLNLPYQMLVWPPNFRFH
jgi:hypothetical protein